MRPQKIEDKELLAALAEVFRTKGYEGASLADLSEATGLKKASLYHRFPKGKKEMALAVFADMDTWVTQNIFKILEEEGVPSEIKVSKCMEQISKLYDGGNDNCIFRALSMDEGYDIFHIVINKGLSGWLESFKKLGLSVGQSPEVANKNAMQTLIDIQGSLIVGKGLKDGSIFKKIINQIQNRYQ